MGKFDGKLFVSDYDNTFQFTEGALRNGGISPPVSPRNLEAVRYWMGEGGRFAIATGRALAAFRRQAEAIPMNAPAIVGNGGGIYDLAAQRYLVKRFLPDTVLERLAAATAAFPGISLEMYHEDPLVQVFSPTEWNRKHALLTGLGFQEVERLDRESVSLPLSKALFAAERDELEALLSYLRQQGWAEDYELIFSSDHLLELTAKGADKGKMALWLKDYLGCEKLFCAGDQANDLPMLRSADRAFVPANAAPEALRSGATAVCHCLDGAIADAVEILERELTK